ncbi:hypothetical protein F4804DRAFT_184188 [Jackrogersella minutella]|nr:hypothetical protein F4804DRAFT_184188 [Jackrogersella minutella]
MLLPRTLLRLRRLLVLRPSKTPSTSVLPKRHTRPTSQWRPQVPFLAVPLSKNHQFRYLTTEKKKWLAYEVFLGFKYYFYFWAIIGVSAVGVGFIQQEWLERQYPSPHEWRFFTRVKYRMVKWAPERPDKPEVDWAGTGEMVKEAIEKLEDVSIEGAGIVPLVPEAEDEGENRKPLAYDITAKSEPWRRGYYDMLMMCAKVAEHLEDHVLDTTRHVIFPANQVKGPSNPSPKPIRHGSPSAPHERDCVPAFENPIAIYEKILATKGFTLKQRMDAVLDYASYLDFKGMTDISSLMYEGAVMLATEDLYPTPPLYDTETYVLQDPTQHPSANLLTTLTSLATHKARTGDLDGALPMLISILRARRSLPHQRPSKTVTYDRSDPHSSPWTFGNILNTAKWLLLPPAYPPPPDDGHLPPPRDAKGLCEEAGLNLYIGEIIFASSPASNPRGREDGLAWTREAIDLSEEQLHRLNGVDGDDEKAAAAKKTCRECLRGGLDNWRLMVSRLARDEREREAADSATAASAGWLKGLWGEGPEDAAARGRWAAEENVVKERTRRAMEVVEKSEAPKAFGLMSLFEA